MKVSVIKLRTVLWFCLVISPFLAMLFMGMVTGTDAFRMDAWNTEWNDEVAYYRTVETMRTVGHPTGFCSYNEVPAGKPSYGTYIYLTYVPYVLLSFVTGISSHNFIVYCNVLMIVLAYFFLVVLLKPTVRQSAWLLLFECTEFIHARYIWSGMSEGNALLLTMAVITCAVWLWEGAGRGRLGKRMRSFCCK